MDENIEGVCLRKKQKTKGLYGREVDGI